ncbi:hypothetical protein DFP73DRAFT_554176 [Morchella snyderi]|nr:hypothetical protein DFP73DRAFT_554176 [Morchella snyderi]
MYSPYVCTDFLLALSCTLPARSTNTCSKIISRSLPGHHCMTLPIPSTSKQALVSQRPAVCIVHSIEQISGPNKRTSDPNRETTDSTRPRGGRSVSYILELEVCTYKSEPHRCLHSQSRGSHRGEIKRHGSAGSDFLSMTPLSVAAGRLIGGQHRPACIASRI